MNYANIKPYDTANGQGVRVSLFVSGCTHHCKGCFNPETWDFRYGNEYTQEIEDKIIDACKHEYIKGLSLLGGEPFEKANQPSLAKLLKRFRKEFPQKDVWCYSGYTFDKDLVPGGSVWLPPYTQEMLEIIDFLVDGEFVEEKKNLRLKFRGSENQRVINVKESLKQGKTIVYSDEEL